VGGAVLEQDTGKLQALLLAERENLRKVNLVVQASDPAK
jgi:hypothetical protein